MCNCFPFNYDCGVPTILFCRSFIVVSWHIKFPSKKDIFQLLKNQLFFQDIRLHNASIQTAHSVWWPFVGADRFTSPVSVAMRQVFTRHDRAVQSTDAWIGSWQKSWNSSGKCSSLYLDFYIYYIIWSSAMYARRFDLELPNLPHQL